MTMISFLVGIAGFVLAMAALGLLLLLRGRSEVEGMMTAQIIGTDGVAVLLLLGAASAMPAVMDVALLLALLAAFASVAFVQHASSSETGNPEAERR